MELPDSPVLEKMTITTFKDENRQSADGEPFEVMFNPESYSLKYENKYQKPTGVNTDRAAGRYSFTKPENLSVTLILDNTGVADIKQGGLGGAAMHVKEYDIYLKVHEFLKATCYMKKETHEPRYLRLEWGDLIYDCRLASVNVTYSLFNRAGQPIRAELACEFNGSLQLSHRVKMESADLSHSRTVLAEENITVITNRIYRDPAYYIRVAQTNRLNNFRRLMMEQSLELPPIEK